MKPRIVLDTTILVSGLLGGMANGAVEMEFDITNVPETALLSEPALAEDWNRPEEDEAWSYLQTDFADYLSNLEDYEIRLARGEIQW